MMAALSLLALREHPIGHLVNCQLGPGTILAAFSKCCEAVLEVFGEGERDE